MSKDDPNKKYYFTEIEPDKVNGVLSEFAKTNSPIAVWEEGGEDKVESFICEHFSTQNSQMSIHPESKWLAEFKTSRLIGKQVLIKIQYGRFYYFSNAILKYKSSANLYFMNINHTIYKSQQRSSYRLEANRLTPLSITINNEVYKAQDLSLGGVSFMISKDKSDDFSKEELFDKCVVNIAENLFDIPAIKIVNAKETEEGIQIGAKFLSMPESVERRLFNLINHHARTKELAKN